MIVRDFVPRLARRLREKHVRLQVVLGPRQVGKTTGIRQLLGRWRSPALYASADEAISITGRWIEEWWQSALEKSRGTLLVLDEIQKIPHWADTVKRLWDAEGRAPRLKVVLLGSSSLDLQRGLSESLAGRFEMTAVRHWGFVETRRAVGWSLDQFLVFGGYPGGHDYWRDYTRWSSYLKSSIVDAVIGNDILTQRSVAKPALFRRAFEILCGFPAQEISYTKLLGQLQDRGNTDLIKHYLTLYEGAFLFKSLFKYSPSVLASRSSSPKIVPLCPALYALVAGPETLKDPALKGRAFEALVGSDLLAIEGADVSYWREGNDEVDFVIRHEGSLFAVEVKSSRSSKSRGLVAFQKRYPASKCAVISFENYLHFAAGPWAFLESVVIR